MANKDPEKRKAYQAEWRAKNKERVAEYDKKRRETNPERAREARRAWAAIPENAEYNKAYCKEYSAKRRKELKNRVFDTLGRTCVMCGFSDIRALQVDHISGGGYKERKRFNNAGRYYEHIVEVGKAEYQILCANCNAIKRIEDAEHRK